MPVTHGTACRPPGSLTGCPRKAAAPPDTGDPPGTRPPSVGRTSHFIRHKRSDHAFLSEKLFRSPPQTLPTNSRGRAHGRRKAKGRPETPSSGRTAQPRFLGRRGFACPPGACVLPSTCSVGNSAAPRCPPIPSTVHVDKQPPGLHPDRCGLKHMEQDFVGPLGHGPRATHCTKASLGPCSLSPERSWT